MRPSTSFTPVTSYDFFTFVRLKNYLSDLLDANVDLVIKRSLKPRTGERILAELKYV